VQPFASAARALNEDWGTNLAGRQVDRWAVALGRGVVAKRDREVLDYQQGRRPAGPLNDPQLLAIGLDGGRVQFKDKNPDTNSRWREDKVCTITSYVPGDGKARKPKPLVTSMVATMRDAHAFGKMVRTEAERRGLRQAAMVIALGDGGNWIDPLLELRFRCMVRIIDWYHAVEHLHESAKAALGKEGPAAAAAAEQWEAWLWDGQVQRVIAALTEHSRRLGSPQSGDGPEHPRRVLQRDVGYFTKHADHMKYPEYRSRGWPVGSGVTESAVKQFNKRVKGTEQFWREARVECILMLRALWISQDERWEKHWANRPAYVN
jgi:hypothetical protein